MPKRLNAQWEVYNVPRKNSNARRDRVFDTRLTFKQACRIVGISPKQRVKLYKLMTNNMKKEVSIKDN